MKKFDVVLALSKIREAKAVWAKGQLEFNSGVDSLMSRLLHEAAANFMSVDEVAKASGFTTKRVRQMMRDRGLDPKRGKRLLSKQAAETLANNSTLLGIEPHEMDLTSPLAYLPMGAQMKRELQDKQVSQVTEEQFLETVVLTEDEKRMAEKLSDAGPTAEEAVEWVTRILAARGVLR